MKTKIQRFFFKTVPVLAVVFLRGAYVLAQSSAGIDQATAEVSSYVDPGLQPDYCHWSCSWPDRRCAGLYQVAKW